MHANSQPKYNSNKPAILTKAIQKLAAELALSQQELSLIIGQSKSTVSRIFKNVADDKSTYLDALSNEGQLAVLLLRLYRNLDVLFGGNAKQCQQWLRSDNKHLDNQPIELIKSIEGLVTVVQYLDTMKCKNRY